MIYARIALYYRDFYKIQYRKPWHPFWRTLEHKQISTFHTNGTTKPYIEMRPVLFQFGEAERFVDRVTEATLFDGGESDKRTGRGGAGRDYGGT